MSVTKGDRLLLRAGYEITNKKDYDLAIVLCARAFENELFRLYCKWYTIENLENSIYLSDAEVRGQISILFRNSPNVVKRINRTITKVSGVSFNRYVHQSKEYRAIINEGFPSIDSHNPADSFHEELFAPRNLILHNGKSGYRKKDAIRIYNIARFGIEIFQEADRERSKQKG